MKQAFARLQLDRRYWTVLYACMAVLFVTGIVTESGWGLGFSIVATAFFGISAVVYGLRWRRDGRWIEPPSEEPVPLDATLTAEVRALMAADRKMQAIKLVRERTGAGLLAAKRTVDGVGDQGRP